jgi:hypothetical protein
MKMIVKARDHKRKMDAEQLQEHLKLNRGNGAHKNKKAYSRKAKHKNAS